MSSHSTASMIFVTGASRSGTTLVARILGSHSRVANVREMHYFGEYCDPRRAPPETQVDVRDVVTKLVDRQNRGILEARGRPVADVFAERVIEAFPNRAAAADVFAATVVAMAHRQHKAIPCEQTPRNIYYASALLDWYPGARFVHMLRDPRGVMASQKYRWRRRSLTTAPSRITRTQQLRAWINYHPYTMIRLWNAATRLALQLEGHPRFMLLKLEDLIIEPERRIREMCSFLEITFEPGMLDVRQVNSSHVSAALQQRGMNRAAITSWEQTLSLDEQALIHRHCAALMSRVGYQSRPLRMSVIGAIRTRVRYLLHLAGAALLNPRRLWIQAQGLRPANWPSR